MGKAVVVALSWILVFPAGLLIFNPLTISIITIKRSWRRRLANLMDGEGPMALAAKVMAVVTFAAMLVAMFVILNPLIVCLIALVAPKWVAETCYGELSDEWWRLCIEIPLSWQGWIGHLLPWYARRHFVEERFRRYSSKDRMRLTLENQQYFFSLSDKEKELVFAYFKTSAEQRMKWVQQRGELSEAMFATLCRDGAESVLAYANLHKGLSSEELGIALNNSKGENLRKILPCLQFSDEQILVLAQWGQYCDILLGVLERQGCGKQAVQQLLEYVKRYSGKNAESKILEALSCWRQKAQVSQLAGYPMLFEQLVKSEELCLAAQVKMTVDQYRIFNLLGKRLTEAALLYFLKYGSTEMVKAILAGEPEWQKNETADGLVKASPELSNLLLKVQLEKKAAEAEKK